MVGLRLLLAVRLAHVHDVDGRRSISGDGDRRENGGERDYQQGEEEKGILHFFSLWFGL